jgi:NAD(P)-dependent dehydrogenase (short-subunit alcohol dehydrogenase family)
MTEPRTPLKLPHTPSLRLDGRRALVTGAGRGLGLAAAAALAQAGAHVFLAARTRTDIEAVAQAIAAEGGSAEALPLDVLDTGAVARAVAECEPFDVLVDSAGTNRPAAFTDVTEEDFDAVVDLNLRSTFFVAQAVARRMIAAKRPGSIIHISSQMGHVGGAHRTVYCASKHAIEGLTKAMAIDLAPHGIRVNSICPTFIETPMTKPFFESAEFRVQVLSKIKLGRIGTVEDIMGAVVLLAGNAASLTTGASLLIDGGWTAE